jgi:type II secretory pathway predicted ATPase ExeA
MALSSIKPWMQGMLPSRPGFREESTAAFHRHREEAIKLLHNGPKTGNTFSVEIPYLEYCGLSEKPFGLTPDPSFYFESRSYRDALDHLRFFLDQKEGFALVYGDVGLGKTTLSRIFLEGLDHTTYHSALILNPIMDESEFIRQILRELNVPTYTNDREELLENLKDFLLEEYRSGKETIIVVDEAQLLSNRLFEFIRVLSNFETDKEKIVHIILFAQPEIIAKLTESSLRYLAQRITVIYRLKPLSHDEVFLYINHRLMRSGSRGFVQFTDDAVKEIFAVSQGCPRIINVISDRSLLYLYSHAKRTVDRGIVRQVLKEESQVLMRPTGKPFRKISYAVAACVVLAMLVFGFKSYLPALSKLFVTPANTQTTVSQPQPSVPAPAAATTPAAAKPAPTKK